MDRQRFHNLDALRGVCALTVVFFHCDGMFASGEIFCHGFLSVDVFFVLSGFVLAHTYESRLLSDLGTTAFVRLRLKRLAPVYWIGTTLGAATMTAISAYHPEGAIVSPFLIVALWAMAMMLVPQMTLPGPAYPTNAAAWSLAGEFIVNIFYARWFARCRTRTLLWVIAALWAAFTVKAFTSSQGWAVGGRADDVWWTPIRATPAFLAGVVLFRAWRDGRFERFPTVSPAVLLGLWAVITEVPTHGPQPAFEAVAVILVSPLLVILLARSRDVAPKPFLWLGAISYPLYASHLSVVHLARFVPLFGLDQGPSVWRAVLVCLVALGLAHLVHRLVERPWLLRWRPAHSASW
jgi:peptidoglycan/LPS O-acetylase OafA/YrhL